MGIFAYTVIFFSILLAAVCGGIIGFVIGVESVHLDFPEPELIDRPTRWRVSDPHLGFESTWRENQYVITDLEGDLFEINCNCN